jgi:formylglycine-generating enzyme required for sulfatase activity
MALVPCPECGRNVSTRAAACPHCGCPIETAPASSQEPIAAPGTVVSQRPAIQSRRAGEIITNSVGMKLTWIPPGRFLMGSSDRELMVVPDYLRKFRARDECPQHPVELTKGFYIGIYPVTQEEYTKVMMVNPSYWSSTGEGKDKIAGMDTSRFPVEQVSWLDACAFCRRLSEMENASYDLPTDAQWEYACRAGAASSQAYHFGDFPSVQHANCDESLGRPCNVGSFPCNAFGLFDMHGNVDEWCKDGFYHYDQSPAFNPVHMDGGNRVYRGGSFSTKSWACRCGSRDLRSDSAPSMCLGFRVVLVD